MKNEQRPLVGLPSKEMVTGHQLANLLNAAGVLLRILEGSRFNDDDDEPQVSAIDGGAKMAAEQALVAVCQKVEEITKDHTRWDTTERDALALASMDVLEANRRFLEAQTESAKLVQKPSFRFRPPLMKLAQGWCAIIGDPNDADNCVMGLGATPQEALDSFDDAFKGAVSEKTLKFCLEHEKMIDAQAIETQPTEPTKDENGRKDPN